MTLLLETDFDVDNTPREPFCFYVPLLGQPYPKRAAMILFQNETHKSKKIPNKFIWTSIVINNIWHITEYSE
jgi:hypothetical protein